MFESLWPSSHACQAPKALQGICADRLTFEEFLKDHLHFKLSHGISPEAVKEITMEIEETDTPETPGGQKSD
jgi:hypothetical protein